MNNLKYASKVGWIGVILYILVTAPVCIWVYHSLNIPIWVLLCIVFFCSIAADIIGIKFLSRKEKL